MKFSCCLSVIISLAATTSSSDVDYSESVLQLPLASSVDDKVIHDPASVEQQTYDYIIVGGGLTGLTAAARLTEDPECTVLVIESGFWESDRSADVYD